MGIEFLWILEYVVFIILGVVLMRHSPQMEWNFLGTAILAIGILRLIDCVYSIVTSKE